MVVRVERGAVVSDPREWSLVAGDTPVTLVADRIVDGDPVVLPRHIAATAVEFIDPDDGDPVDLTVVSIEDSRFFGVVATNLFARDDMPQIPVESLTVFRSEMADTGVLSWKEDVDPRSLWATQNELCARKTSGMISSIRSGQLDPVNVPIVVSSDGRILDGHHRWAAEVLLAGEGKRTTTVVRVDIPMASLMTIAAGFAGRNGIASKLHGMAVEFRAAPDQPRHPAGSPEGGRWVSIGGTSSADLMATDAARIAERFNPGRAIRSKRQALNDLDAAYEAAGTATNRPRVVSSDELAEMERDSSKLTANIIGSEKDLAAFVDGDRHPAKLGLRGNGTLAIAGKAHNPTMRAFIDRDATMESERDMLNALNTGRRVADGTAMPTDLTGHLAAELGPDVMARMDPGTFAALRGVQIVQSLSSDVTSTSGPIRMVSAKNQPYIILDRSVVTTDRSTVPAKDYRHQTKSGLPIQSFQEEVKQRASEQRRTDRANSLRDYNESVDRNLKNARIVFALDAAADHPLTEDERAAIIDRYAGIVPPPGAGVDEWIAVLDSLVIAGPDGIDPALRPLFDAAVAAAEIDDVAPVATVDP